MGRSARVSDPPSRPITFRAAEDMGPFELARLWVDTTAWPVAERSKYDELAELAVMSALETWMHRWQPIAIHGAMLAGARPEAVAAALGKDLLEVYERWHEWALRQKDLIIGSKPRITPEEYDTVEGRFAGSAFCEPAEGGSP